MNKKFKLDEDDEDSVKNEGSDDTEVFDDVDKMSFDEDGSSIGVEAIPVNEQVGHGELEVGERNGVDIDKLSVGLDGEVKGLGDMMGGEDKSEEEGEIGKQGGEGDHHVCGTRFFGYKKRRKYFSGWRRFFWGYGCGKHGGDDRGEVKVEERVLCLRLED